MGLLHNFTVVWMDRQTKYTQNINYSLKPRHAQKNYLDDMPKDVRKFKIIYVIAILEKKVHT